MTWDEIMKYADIIKRIALKYSGDPDLASDVVHEVMLKLFEDKKLDISKFDPKKKDAAVRNTIRNKALKVLRSKKIGRWSVDSLDELQYRGYQIDTNGDVVRDPGYVKHPFKEEPDDIRDGG